jgi:hypothetical protein
MIDSNEEKPYYTHDCNKCVFLGGWRGKQTAEDRGLQNYDLYVCGDNVVARYGDDGPEYISGMEFVGMVYPLTEAKKRAELFGIDFEVIKREKRNDRLVGVLKTFQMHWDVLRVFQWFSDMKHRLWMVEDDFYVDLAEVMAADEFTPAQIKAAVDFVKACRTKEEDFFNAAKSQD